MTLILALLGLLLILASLPGTLELLALTLAGLKRPRFPAVAAAPLKLAVVVPAHNEATGIAACVKNLSAADYTPGSVEIIVIADNCTDATAEHAQQAGARVLVRTNPNERGKGYALDYAFTQLLAEPFDAFLVIDADSRVDPDLFVKCKQAFTAGADALQCRYADDTPPTSARGRLLRLAWLAFNVLRPRGRENLGLSVGILGNGFGLTRATLAAVPYRARSIVEDLEYHLQLVESGRRVRYLDGVCVWSPLPQNRANAAAQRSRWEGGRVRMIREFVPQLTAAVAAGKTKLLEPLLELLLLPLAWHVSLLLLALLWPWGPARGYALLGLAVVGLHLVATLWVGRCGWDDVRALLAAPFYLLWKLALLPRTLRASGRGAAWQRTEREDKPS